jgi:anaerobic selenocysteine-containing dehydrogenase
MHPSDANERGLGDGSRVAIANTRGTVYAYLHITDAVRPGVVVLPGKWWGQPADTAAVANVLTPSAWSSEGQPAYNDTFVTVEATATAAQPGTTSPGYSDVDVRSSAPSS